MTYLSRTAIGIVLGMLLGAILIDTCGTRPAHADTFRASPDTPDAGVWFSSTYATDYKSSDIILKVIESGRTIVTIDGTGKVTVANEIKLDEATRLFWRALRESGYRCADPDAGPTP